MRLNILPLDAKLRMGHKACVELIPQVILKYYERVFKDEEFSEDQGLRLLKDLKLKIN
jgi:hypothetical protein